MKYAVWLSPFFAHPSWAWHLMKFSDLNPGNSLSHHTKRISQYRKYELDLLQLVQQASKASKMEACSILEKSAVQRGFTNSMKQILPTWFDASPELAALCYSLVRLTKPSVVVETGVGRGVTSYQILRALKENRKGILFSIELPMLKLGAKKDVGVLVPTSLRSRWKLIYGPGVREMNRLRKQVQNIDMFVHDSNHSYLNQRAEYQFALHWLKKGGLLVSDDVGNDALLEASEEFNGRLMMAKQPKSKYIGVIAIEQ